MTEAGETRCWVDVEAGAWKLCACQLGLPPIALTGIFLATPSSCALPGNLAGHVFSPFDHAFSPSHTICNKFANQTKQRSTQELIFFPSLENQLLD
jgi:hypothetical protein